MPAWKKIGKEEGRKPEWLHHNCCGSASFSPESWCKHSAEAVQLSWRFQFNVSCFETWMTAVLLKQSEQHHDEGEKEVDLQHLVVQSWRFPVHTPCQFFIIRPQILFFSLISLNIDLFNVTSHLCFTRIFLGDRQLHEEIFTNENISWFQNHSSLSYGTCPFRSQTEWKLWEVCVMESAEYRKARTEFFSSLPTRTKIFFVFENKDKNNFYPCKQGQKYFYPDFLRLTTYSNQDRPMM